MAQETAFENGRISNFERLMTLTLTIGSGYSAHPPPRASLIERPLPTRKISLKCKKRLVDGRTYVRTDGHLRPVLLGRLCRGKELGASAEG